MKSFVDKEYLAMLARAREKLTTSDERCSYLLMNFKASDTPPSGPDYIAGHSAKRTRPNHKEIA